MNIILSITSIMMSNPSSHSCCITPVNQNDKLQLMISNYIFARRIQKVVINTRTIIVYIIPTYFSYISHL